MPACSTHDVILVRYPFSDASSAKVRPAVVVSAPHPSRDFFVVPLTAVAAKHATGADTDAPVRQVHQAPA